MSDVYPSIEIDGYTFSILEKKYDHRGYKYINIGSFHEYNRVRIYAENTNIFNLINFQWNKIYLVIIYFLLTK